MFKRQTSLKVEHPSKRTKPSPTNIRSRLEVSASELWAVVNNNASIIHVFDYMTGTKPADFANLVSKGMPTALITEMNKVSSNIESLADKAASKTDPELNPQEQDRGTYCVWAHPKDTNQTKLSLSPTKCALPA
ncbi:hypothetical protein D6C95_06554 [Aureobasidium pullulans]|nr:hypothetical protein D6C95_06554 [Aureobasidium pullulans]